jgi:phospholipid/cholesterol/gamma-HCH transport system substrate-binding protein
METEGRYTLVGIVVLGIMVALTLAIVWLAGGANRIAYQTYSVYFAHQSLDGLAVGSPVKIRGIKVGVVDGYRFSGGTGEAVRVTVRIDEGVPVLDNAVAYIKRNLVTGIATVEIRNAPGSTTPLTLVPPGEHYPVIAEGKSDLDNVANAVSTLAENGAQVLQRMNTLLSDDNQRMLLHTIRNLDALAANLASNKNDITAALKGVEQATADFSVASAAVTQAAAHTDTNVRELSQNASVALQEATVAMRSLQQDSALITARIQDLSETSSLELTNMSRDVRTSADALTIAGQRLSDPRAAIFGAGKAVGGPGEK